jgi:hypothetical protein
MIHPRRGVLKFSAGVPLSVILHIQCTTNNHFMCLDEKHLTRVLYVAAFIEVILYILYFLLSPFTAGGSHTTVRETLP